MYKRLKKLDMLKMCVGNTIFTQLSYCFLSPANEVGVGVIVITMSGRASAFSSDSDLFIRHYNKQKYNLFNM